MATTIPAIELTTGRDPTGSVIWLHGLGADGWDFVPIVQELGLPETLALRFIFPHAPRQAVSINGGAVMRAWYDIALDGLARRVDEAGILASASTLTSLVQGEAARGIAADRVILAGFSQGGVIALQAGLRYPDALAGIVALSTYLAMPGTVAVQGSAANRSVPILMAHGTQDTVIPLAMAEESRRQLLDAGYKVDWHTYPMGHSVAREELQQISRFLQNRLK